MLKRLFSIFLYLTVPFGLTAQELMELARYDETNGGPQGHITQLLQDRKGRMWIATWNGLCRFDGYEFRQFKPQAGDGCTMTNDRLRNIWLSTQGDIFCRAEDDVYRFDLQTCRFHNLTDNERKEAEHTEKLLERRGRFNGQYIEYTDSQGLQWQVHDNVLSCMKQVTKPEQPLYMPIPAMVRMMKQDQKGRIWLSSRQDATLRLLSAEGSELGYLPHEGGRISNQYQQFGSPVFCFCQTRKGDIWLGSKPDGLFRLRETSENIFEVKHVDGLANTNVYSIAEDSEGRLWVATLGGGISLIEQAASEQPVVTNNLTGYPKDKCQLVRFIHITTNDILLATTTEGLIIAQLEHHKENIRFHRHCREANRISGLSCNATMDIAESGNGQLFISTETGGFCEIISKNLLADTLTFRHYDRQWGLPSDMIVSMATDGDNRLLLTSNTQLMLVDLTQQSCKTFGISFFHHPYRFSEVKPLLLKDGRWLVATLENAFLLSQKQMQENGYQPPLVLTGVKIQNGLEDLAADRLDTLILAPVERNLTIQFAALDYQAPATISYQFCLSDDIIDVWNNIGHNHSLTLLDLNPGTHRLYLRSTNADGQWTDNIRTLTIIVKPTFWETPWAILLFIFVGTVIIIAVVYTYLYIKRIERNRQETLAKYLELLEKHQQQIPLVIEEHEEDPFQKNLLAFVEANIGNSEADVQQMAEACAVSRSGLQRKMRNMMGVSPADFLREARLKRAAQLLRHSDLSVSEVAYRCGFSDPKYFSRCFKVSTGLSPSDYKVENSGIIG